MKTYGKKIAQIANYCQLKSSLLLYLPIGRFIGSCKVKKRFLSGAPFPVSM